MVDNTYVDDLGNPVSAYQITDAGSWAFNRDTCAATATYYTAGAGVWNQAPPTCTGGGREGVNCLPANQPPVPSAPAVPPEGQDSVKFHAQADRCTFFCGGDLADWSYTQTATVNGLNGNGNWTFTFNYTTTAASAAPETCWTFEPGAGVNINVEGFVSSESFLRNGATNKYSFTLLEGGLSRVRDTSAQLQLFDTNLNSWVNVGSPVDLDNLDTNSDSVNDALAVSSATADYSYFANGGTFGNPAVTGALHASGGKAANQVTKILNGIEDGSTFLDNFAGNNNDLTAGNVHKANYGTVTVGNVSVAGDYRVVISGTIKGNAGSASIQFAVSAPIPVLPCDCQ